MTDSATPGRGFTRFVRRIRLIHLAPVFAFLALSAWAFASPIGAAPDDDYHLVSIWCADGGNAECQPGTDSDHRKLDVAFAGVTCYAGHQDVSAACQFEQLNARGSYETNRGNFAGEYPPVYYSVMHLFAGPDIQVSALTMRLVNAALFVALATALAGLLSTSRRRTLLWGWLVAVIPLGIFLIPSNNPSSWAIMGVGTAFLALLGWFETAGRRRWALGALYLVGVIMASGARGDAGVYVVGASVTAAVLSFGLTRSWATRAILPVVGIVIAVLFFVTAGQSGVGAIGFTSGQAFAGPGGVVVGIPADVPLTGFALGAYNLLMLPYLWTGVWGTWALGWFDTGFPAIVPWAGAAAFIVVAFAGLGRLEWRKAISILGVLVVLIVLPVYVLTVGGTRVGQALQPRYLLPLILLLSLLLTTMPRGRELVFSRIQTFTIFAAIAGANFVALQVNIRRYVTGADQQGANLDAGSEWWWTGLPVGPTAVWVLGALAFAGLLAVLWPVARRPSLDLATTPPRLTSPSKSPVKSRAPKPKAAARA
ncbi:MAG: DUF2142 domain-containing protein [Pseudolysinimonas sp.]|uniref:DUF2142 domain-containing protein n=1 Tax=Pseudolysinimonas sp. TaxID=2680009 RepID=UPI003265C531